MAGSELSDYRWSEVGLNALVTHLIIELSGCDPRLLGDLEHIRGAMVMAALEAGATVVAGSFHKFSPGGVTGIVAIAQSHLSIHTWTEHGYAAADIFTCGAELQPRMAAEVLVERLHSARPEIIDVARGPAREPAASHAL